MAGRRVGRPLPKFSPAGACGDPRSYRGRPRPSPSARENTMPAVTADYLALPRLEAMSTAPGERPVTSVTTAPAGFEGEGFPVHRAFAAVPLSQLDPFVHMDQMGEVE